MLVIHENRGLNAPYQGRGAAARRWKDFARSRRISCRCRAGTPANEDAAREAIGKLDLAKVDRGCRRDARTSWPSRSRGGKVGAVGFCWGGAFVNRLAVAAGDKLDAGVSYYGPAPDPSEAAKVQAPLLIHLAGLDTRVAQTAFPWIAALRAAGKQVTYQAMKASITPSTTTRRPSATTRPRPTSPGSARSASSANTCA